jgi:hypothetical protein
MRKFAFVALLLVGLAGCATTNSPYGNFAQNSPAADDQKMADDAVKQLVAVYPPASTRFDLHQVTPDAFGASLVESMRAKGYALLEFKPAPAGQQGRAATAASDATATPAPAAPGLPLRYIVDQAAGSNLYRVTLLVGNQSLTRAYSAQNGSVFPAGAWVRKE